MKLTTPHDPPPSAPPRSWNSKNGFPVKKTFPFPFRSMFQVPSVRVAWCRVPAQQQTAVAPRFFIHLCYLNSTDAGLGAHVARGGYTAQFKSQLLQTLLRMGSEVDTSELLPLNGYPFGAGSYSYLRWRTTGKHTSFFWQNSEKFHASSKATVPTPMLRWCLGWSSLIFAVGVSPEKESNLKSNNLEVPRS